MYPKYVRKNFKEFNACSYRTYLYIPIYYNLL